MKRTNKEVVEYFYERVFNAGDFSELDDLMWDDYKQHSRKLQMVRKDSLNFSRNSFRDIRRQQRSSVWKTEIWYVCSSNVRWTVVSLSKYLICIV